MSVKKSTKYVSLAVGIAFVMSVSSVMLHLDSEHSVSANKSSEDHHLSQTIDSKDRTIDNERFTHELSHDQIVSLTDQFMETLVQETNERNQVIHFDTKSVLLEEFEKITTKEVAADYVEFYFTEKNGELYIKPTETPPWFNENSDYDMIHEGNHTVKVIQENTTDLYGTYTIMIEFKWKDGQWRITGISHQ